MNELHGNLLTYFAMIIPGSYLPTFCLHNKY